MDLLEILKERFEGNMGRHEGVSWAEVAKRLEGNKSTLESLRMMEESGGEPDVIFKDGLEYMYFMDCSAESPMRRSLCYDEAALESRKKNKPEASAEGVAREMGVELLDEEYYFLLQSLGEFDLKTSSWLKTPVEIREKGGAIFGDRRFGRVFVYHNGAESYYAARGFRGKLKI